MTNNNNNHKNNQKVASAKDLKAAVNAKKVSDTVIITSGLEASVKAENVKAAKDLEANNDLKARQIAKDKAAAAKELLAKEAAEAIVVAEEPITGLRRTSSTEAKLLAKKAIIVEETDHNGTVVDATDAKVSEELRIEAATDAANAIQDEIAAKALQVKFDLAAAVKHEEDTDIQIQLDHAAAVVENDRLDAAAKLKADAKAKLDKDAADIASILNDEGLTDVAKWATIVRIASSKIDETTITDLSLISDTEIMRRLRLLWSKRVAAKKNNDIVALEQIANDEAELQSHRTVTKRSGSTVSAAADPTKLSQSDLNKLIRNVQSKKCTAKKSANLVEVAQYQAEEDKLKLLRTNEPTVKGPSAMSLKIGETIAALEALPQSQEVTDQIAMLKSLM